MAQKLMVHDGSYEYSNQHALEGSDGITQEVSLGRHLFASGDNHGIRHRSGNCDQLFDSPT